MNTNNVFKFKSEYRVGTTELKFAFIHDREETYRLLGELMLNTANLSSRESREFTLILKTGFSGFL